MSKENNENLVIEPFFNTIEVCNNLNNMMYYGDIYAVYCINCAVSENNNVHLYVNELAEFKFKEDAEFRIDRSPNSI